MARPRKAPAKKTAEQPPEPVEEKPKPRAGQNKLTAAAKVARDAKVVAFRARGKSWTEVGKEVGLHPDTCMKIWGAFVEQGKLAIQQTDPVEVVFDQIARLDSDISLLADLAEEGDNTSAKVGAIRTKAQLMAQQTELLQAVGLVPKNIGSLKVEIEIRYVVQQMLVLLKEVSAKTMTYDEAEERLVQMLERKAPQPRALNVGENN